MSEDRMVPKFTKQMGFKLAEFAQRVHWLPLLEAHRMSDVENPVNWVHILADITRGDEIKAWKEDTGEYAKFIVLEAGKGHIKLGKIEAFVPEEVSVPDGGFEPKWNVGKRAFDVRRTADGYVMSSGFQTKASAVAWITDHMAKTKQAA